MYPFFRLAKELTIHRNAAALPLTGTHISRHICWPWDLDPWIELNNGRTLTLYDLGRLPLGRRVGLDKVLRAQGWGLAVAGVSVRYRKRIKAFERIEMHSRCIGWDARFLYMVQSMWKHGECANQMLLRSACTSAQGIVAPARLLQALGSDDVSPALEPWVQAWIDADALRPWPPVR